MPRHKSLKSFLGDHINSDKDDELRRNKTEMDEKILNYAKENEEDDNSPVAADLIEDIHNYYNSLYAHYNHMTEELRKKADISYSSSSDSSDNNDSPSTKCAKTGKITNHLDETAAVARIKDLEMQLDSSHNYVRELKKQRDDELFALQKKLNEQEQDSLSLMNNLIQQNESLSSQVKDLKDEISELQRVQKEVDAKDKEVYKLEDMIEELRQELEMKIDEISTLVENLRTAEVKQRLTSQKLCITEQLLGEKDEIHRQRIDKLLEEGKLLKEKNAKLEREITEKIRYMLARIDTLSEKFEEDYEHLESRVYEIVNEVRIVMKWISETKVEKGQLKKENRVLAQQLNDGKEQELLFMEKIEELETTLSMNTDKMNGLIRTVKEHEENIQKLKKTIQERDEKLENLERRVKEKEDGIISLSEEKREAIRQLCTSIDYHQNRYNDLRDMIMKKGGRRRLISTT